MPIAPTDIKYRYSGGSSNSDPNACLGGIMSTTTEITTDTSHNAFDIVSGAESLAGDTEYRGFYCLNNHGSLTAEATHLYISSNTTSSTTSLECALADEGLNVTMETIGTENDAPSGPSFSSPATYAAGLDMGNIPFGQRYGFWLKRIVNAGTSAMNNDTCTINIDCDTAA